MTNSRPRILIAVVLLTFALSPPPAGAQTPALPPPAVPIPADINITGLPITVATNQSLTLMANVMVHSGGSLAGDVRWSFGDGGTATGTTVTHAYRSAGGYDVHASAGGSSVFFSGVATVSTDVQVTVQDSVTLQPGGSITFASPFVLPAPYFPGPGSPPGSPPVVPRGGFGPLNLEIADASDQPLTTSYTLQSSGAVTPAPPATLDLALPEGEALQATSGTSPAFSPGPALNQCAPAGDGANEATCTVPTASNTTGMQGIDVSAANASGSQTLTLAPGGTALLLGPELQTGVPLLLLHSMSAQASSILWDGATLEIGAPDGYAVSVESARGLPPNAALEPVACSPSDAQPSVVDCPLSAIPPVQISFSTVVQAPSGTLSLPYSDDQGPGTMTITTTGPDAAPGGAAIEVALDQNGATYTGSGVMRPQVQSGFLLAFELSGAAGNGYLYENRVTADAGGFSGKGLWLSEADETQAGPWTLGTPAETPAPFSGGSIQTNDLNFHQCPPDPCTVPPPPGQLPLFNGDQLISGFVTLPPAQAAPVLPPAAGQAGQPVGLLAITSLPCCGQNASQTYQWSFGDGTMSPPSGQQRVTHTWSAPGVYTIAVVFTDTTGVSTFALTQVQIAPAGS